MILLNLAAIPFAREAPNEFASKKWSCYATPFEVRAKKYAFSVTSFFYDIWTNLQMRSIQTKVTCLLVNTKRLFNLMVILCFWFWGSDFQEILDDTKVIIDITPCLTLLRNRRFNRMQQRKEIRANTHIKSLFSRMKNLRCRFSWFILTLEMSFACNLSMPIV